MKKHFIVVVLSFIYLAVNAQDEVFSESRTVEYFNRISSCCGIEVAIEEGESSTIKVETNDKGTLHRIETNVKNRELIIGMNGSSWTRPKNLKMKVTIPASKLDGIRGSSGALIYTMGTLNGDDVTISANSGANINLNLDVTNIECESSSGSTIKLAGKANFTYAQAGSGAIIDTNELISAKADASASSGAIVKTNATNEINAKASSGGSVVYSGEGKLMSRKRSSGGRIEQE